MPSYKLFYFPIRGNAEGCRLALAAADIEYEDIRLDKDQWAKEKESGDRSPFCQMPFLEVDGKFLGQSKAILRYICKLGGLCPSDSFEEARADMIVDSVEDLKLAVLKPFYEKDEKKKEDLEKEFLETTLPPKLKCFEAILKEDGTDFFIGGKLTYADIAFFHLFNTFFVLGKPEVPEQLNDHLLLVKLYNRVLNDPKIKAWIEKRPESEF